MIFVNIGVLLRLIAAPFIKNSKRRYYELLL